MDSVDAKKSNKKSPKLNQGIQTSSRLSHDDESIMKKLAEMSIELSKDTSLSNLDFRTGAVSTDSSLNNRNNIYDRSNYKTSISTSRDQNNQDLTFVNMNSFKSMDEAITNDLKNFLKSHNIKDGNLSDTRKLDLRSSQSVISNTRTRVYSKPKAETLFQEILSDTSVYPNGKDDKKLKFINENENDSTSSSDSDTEEENNSALWIERYRKQKLLNLKKN